MARKHRDMEAGMFHVYAHCVWATDALFRDDVDRLTFLRELARACGKVSWTCVGYCLMRSHYHLIVEVEKGALPKGMHALNFRYACQFNVRHAMRGHVFGARYDSRRVADTHHLLTVYKYVMRNPVEAGLCSSPEEWPWSSYAAAVGLSDPITFVHPDVVFDCLDAGDDHTTTARLRWYVEGP